MQILKLKNIGLAEIAESTLMLEGYKYSLKDYPMFRPIFNSAYSRKLMMSGRQVSKTMTFAANIVSEAMINPYLPMIYTNASNKQTTSFSTSKLDPFLMHSPIAYNTLMKFKEKINNVYNKRFKNYSTIRLTYFSDSADRIRGETAHRLYADEVQDVLYDALIDAEETLSACPDPRFFYAGTSKTMNTTLAFLWSLSTQKEWVIKCEGCGKWNIPDINCIDKKGLVCKKCKKLLNTYSGHWRSFNKNDAINYDGFHIPQIILPLHCCNEDKWAKLIYKMETYPEYKFLTEVLGSPMGEGDMLITEDLLKSMCIPELKKEAQKSATNASGAFTIVAGIDWGGGGISGTSRTVLSIFAVYPDKQQYIKIFGKIYSGGEPTKHVQDIAQWLFRFDVHNCYGDHGGGNFALSQLAELCPAIRVVPVMYTDQTAPFKWDETAKRFTINRTNMIDCLIADIKAGKVKTFNWEEFRPFAMDFLNVHEEILGEHLGKGRRAWRHYPSKPDDALHSMVFGWFAARVVSGHVDFTIFGKGVDA